MKTRLGIATPVEEHIGWRCARPVGSPASHRQPLRFGRTCLTAVQANASGHVPSRPAATEMNPHGSTAVGVQSSMGWVGSGTAFGELSSSGRRHLRDSGARWRTGPPRPGAQRGGAPGQRLHDDLRLALVRSAAGLRSRSSRPNAACPGPVGPCRTPLLTTDRPTPSPAGLASQPRHDADDEVRHCGIPQFTVSWLVAHGVDRREFVLGGGSVRGPRGDAASAGAVRQALARARRPDDARVPAGIGRSSDTGRPGAGLE